MNLDELFTKLDLEYSNQYINLETFNFRTLSSEKLKQPKYLFRGEKSIYATTNTTLKRLLNDKGQNFVNKLKVVNLRLYEYLKLAIWNQNISDDSDSSIELAIVGIMQHYGFETSFLDLTSNLKVALNFAAQGEVGKKGQLLVIESKKLNNNPVNYYFDLTTSIGLRLKKQYSFVLWDQHRNLDLSNQSFLTVNNGEWYEFVLTEKDKTFFSEHSLLKTNDDKIASLIVEWWNLGDLNNLEIDSEIKLHIDAKIHALN